MSTANRDLHFRAVRMLLLTTLFWGLSFPIVRSLSILQQKLLPETNLLFHAGLTGFVRFSAATVVMLFLCYRTLPRLTRSELWQGVGLGFFAGMGILLQMDGLSYTSASMSAFLTQTFCVYVPIIVAVRDRVSPRIRVVISILLMLAGVAVLNTVDFKTLNLGRGEWQTILAAVFFSAQIVWLERPRFKNNDVNHFSLVMFATMSLMSLPLVLAFMRSPRDILVCYSDPGVWLLSGSLLLFCTIFAFVMMNKWQPLVPATEAAIIYGGEPVCASLMALFLPGLISAATGIIYPNERLTWNLLIGGALIVISNLVLQLKWNPRVAEPVPLG